MKYTVTPAPIKWHSSFWLVVYHHPLAVRKHMIMDDFGTLVRVDLQTLAVTLNSKGTP